MRDVGRDLMTRRGIEGYIEFTKGAFEVCIEKGGVVIPQVRAMGE